MFTIIISDGNEAEAEDEEAVLTAIRTLIHEDGALWLGRSRMLTATVYNDGQYVGKFDGNGRRV